MSSEVLQLVVAYIQPFQLEKAVDTLRLLPNFPGMSVSDVRGFGRHGAHPPHAGERTEVEPFEKRIRIEIFCRAKELQSIVYALRGAAHTGHAGDGKIFVLPVEFALTIRTGTEGTAAVVGPDEAAK